MKKLSIFFLFLFFSGLHANETPRRLIVLLDWDNERISNDLDKATSTGETGLGAVSISLLTALNQKAAPIIVTSSLWHNFVARRKLFKDFLEGRGAEYKKYTRFNNDVAIKQFQKYVQAYFQPTGEKILGNVENNIRIELNSYFLYYITPFEEHEWIIKKVSDYIYVLIPQAYVTQLRLKPLQKTEDNFVKPLTQEELLLGLKIDATTMKTISYQDALNPDKHKLSIDENDYAQLFNEKDAYIFTQLVTRYRWVPVPKVIISKHFINLLKYIFVTTLDLIDKNKDITKTETNRALYLHRWHIYLQGHGSKSSSGVLQEIDVVGETIHLEFISLAGLELRAFREWLAFLNSNIRTEFLFYESCYSGGQHLQKLYEHQWDYSTGVTKKVETKPDVFNYTIVAGNLAYTLTVAWMPMLSPPYKKIALNSIEVDYRIQFPPFFKAAEKYFSPSQITAAQKKAYFEGIKRLKVLEEQNNTMRRKMVSKKLLQQVDDAIKNLRDALEKLHFITLSTVIDYVHNVKEHHPAVRFPGTEWFIPLPLDETQDIIERIRLETEEQKKARGEEKKHTEDVIGQHLESKDALRKAVHVLQQKLVQLVHQLKL